MASKQTQQGKAPAKQPAAPKAEAKQPAAPKAEAKNLHQRQRPNNKHLPLKNKQPLPKFRRSNQLFNNQLFKSQLFKNQLRPSKKQNPLFQCLKPS
jgi:hypothetical protein